MKRRSYAAALALLSPNPKRWQSLSSTGPGPSSCSLPKAVWAGRGKLRYLCLHAQSPKCTYTLWRQGRRVHLQGSGVAWSSRRVVASLASCTLVQSRGHGCGPRGRHLACLMVQWLAMLQLLLLGVHQGSAQDLTHTQEPALKWRGECSQRRDGGRLAPGIRGGKPVGIEQDK